MNDLNKDSDENVKFDRERVNRIGLEEAVLAEPKSIDQIVAIIKDSINEGRRLLLTRMMVNQFEELPNEISAALDYCAISHTAIIGEIPPAEMTPRIALVSGGTSDCGPVTEAQRVLSYSGLQTTKILDVGVAGLWRLLEYEQQLFEMDVVIVFAGMDAALPTVVAGLVPGLVIAVPTSVGYGVAEGGRTALDAILASCAPGIMVMNIDNGYGAACAAIRFRNSCRRMTQRELTR